MIIARLRIFCACNIPDQRIMIQLLPVVVSESAGDRKAFLLKDLSGHQVAGPNDKSIS